MMRAASSTQVSAGSTPHRPSASTFRFWCTGCRIPYTAGPLGTWPDDLRFDAEFFGPWASLIRLSVTRFFLPHDKATIFSSILLTVEKSALRIRPFTLGKSRAEALDRPSRGFQAESFTFPLPSMLRDETRPAKPRTIRSRSPQVPVGNTSHQNNRNRR